MPIRCRACALLLALLFATACGHTVVLAGNQIPRLGALVDEPTVRLNDGAGDVVTIRRGTPLTLFIDGMEPFRTRPDELGFADTSLRLNELSRVPGPVIEYDRILRLEVRVSGGADKLAWILPVSIGGAVVVILLVYTVVRLGAALGAM
jgi:hypothetical protein